MTSDAVPSGVTPQVSGVSGSASDVALMSNLVGLKSKNGARQAKSDPNAKFHLNDYNMDEKEISVATKGKGSAGEQKILNLGVSKNYKTKVI